MRDRASAEVREVRAVVAALVALLALAAAPAPAAERPRFTELVEQEYRSVVNISTSREVEPQAGGLPPGFDMPDPEESPFGELFRRFFGERGRPPVNETASLGSGFIVGADGYVLTNGHVVEDADEIVVRLHDRRQFAAEVVGVDERSDIALLHIDAQGLPTVDIGNPAELEVGEWVVAIGSPFGFDHSVTAGIVSAKGRSLPRDNYVPFIQTDVAINPGNSGGPLFNLDGEVVGVNAQIFSRTGGFMGLSFAIPIDVAMDVVEQLRDDGEVRRGWLGVMIQEVTRDLAESFGMERARGALVSRVLPGSPADRAGLRTGDVIVEYNDRPVRRSGALPPMVGRTDIGSRARLGIIRDGERIDVPVTIGRLPDEDRIAAYGERRPGASEPPAAEANGERLGLRVEAVAEARREALGIGPGGVGIAGIVGEPARSSELREGDVVTMMNARPVQGVDDFRERVAELPAGRTVALLVERDDGPRFVAIEVPEAD